MSNQTNEDNSANIVSIMALNDNKAGMKGLDKEKINRIIMENTKGSKYYKNEQKKEQQIKERIEKMKIQLNSYSNHDRQIALKQADEMISKFEDQRDLTRTIIHIDMDAFYASVEERDKPELKTKPMAVGGNDMLSTSNYIARRFGVRAAMPGFIAKKLCPQLVIVPVNFDKYRQVSKEVQEIFSEYDENFSAMSLDEAYLDITVHLLTRLSSPESVRTFHYHTSLAPTNGDETKTFGFDAEEVTQEIRFRIHQKTLLTASAGIAPNTMLAKIGSDLNKPNGQTYFKPDRDENVKFVQDLPIRKIGGVGKVSEQQLLGLGITTCRDLFEKREQIVLLFSQTSASFFLRTVMAISANMLAKEGERKSISTERTFQTISNHKELMVKLMELCESLVEDMKKNNVQGKTVTLKTKTVDFELHTRSRTSNNPLSSKDEIYNVAKQLLEQEISHANNNLSLRLMGIGMSKLEDSSSAKQQPTMLSFFKDTKNKSEKQGNDEKCTDELKGNEIQKSVSLPDCSLKANDINILNNDAGNKIQASHIANLANNKIDAEEIILPETTEETRQPFFRSRKLNTCPNCQENFPTLLKLNQHLDDCILPNTPEPQCSNHVEPKTPNHIDAIQQENISEKNTEELLQTEEYECPICRVKYDATHTSLAMFNVHVDSCLNQKAIKDLLQNEKELYKNPVKKRKLNKKQNTIRNFFSK